ncbi:anaerobic C4-dicarboxylate transporter [Elizabethkingia argentiflava]|uniref:Anaerobic C4-dicarboxylate transporter n=1 Tax=Elizabethkingia argenteiflava TaxID=2681556 RepID=A0A845PWJ3_9FLAO|nr:anaerobic C4-dicarboxylate transporter [Elizabethkingia argenteiflava]NAW51236.1 anaerobic C4-dicarboxylate transporter [Elizabethkingia argenteiflava]
MILTFIQFLIVLASIFIGARIGGIGLGIFGMIGLAILVFFFGLQPGEAPIDVMLMILAVITAAATLQAAKGLDYMVYLAEKILRSKPSAITFLGPLVCYLFTFLAGTGHIAYSLLPIISEIATQSKIRPERPLSISVIASQQAITASPISAATAALLTPALLGGQGITLSHILMISIPATLTGVLVGALISNYMGKELEQDPEYLKRLKAGLIATNVDGDQKSSIQNDKRAKRSVLIFLLGVALVVLLGSLENLRPSFNVNGQVQRLRMPEAIEMIMMVTAGLILFFSKVNINKVPSSSVFLAGIQAVVAIFGIAWLGNTFFQGNLKFFQESIHSIVTQYNFLFALALFIMSIFLFSQAATVRTLYPLGIALGISPWALLAMYPAVNGYFFIPNYPTVVAAINFDRTGSTRIGKYLLNHSFQVPGIVSTIIAVSMGFLLISFI